MNAPDTTESSSALEVFFAGRTFKTICLVLIVFAIVFGIYAGTLKSRRVSIRPERTPDLDKRFRPGVRPNNAPASSGAAVRKRS